MNSQYRAPNPPGQIGRRAFERILAEHPNDLFVWASYSVEPPLSVQPIYRCGWRPRPLPGRSALGTESSGL